MTYPKSTYVSPDKLRSNPWNSNIVSPENEKKLDEAIRRLGFIKAIIVREVDGELEILGGEHRRDSAKRIGLAEVPIFNLGPIDDVKAKEISLADNARYGADDTLQLAAILEDLNGEDIATFLPYTDSELESIANSVSIALDDLELDEEFDAKDEKPEPPAAKAPKTHTIMRFKVALSDAERLTGLLAKTQKRFGFTTADELTNAGDALIHLLVGAEARTWHSGDDPE